MAREDEYRLPNWAELETAIPKYDYAELTDPDNPWLRKTDWCCDRIIGGDK